MKKLLSLLLSLLVFGIGNAFAFPLYQAEDQYAGTQFEDDNIDYFVDVNNDGLIGVGDRMYSAIEFTKVLDITPPPNADQYFTDQDVDEIVAWSVIELKSIDQYGWHFGQYGNTPMVEFYTGLGTYDLDVTVDQTLAYAEAAVKDGATFLWSFSITDDPDTFWTFTPLDQSANDPDAVRDISSTTKVGVLNYQLNQVGGEDIFNPFKGDFTLPGGDGYIDLGGSGDILGGRHLTEAFARSDIDVSVAPVPEPATLTLFGFSLLGLAFIGRRRK